MGVGTQRLSDKGLPLAMAGFGVGASLIWCVLYSEWGAHLSTDLDPDAFGALGMCLWRGSGFAFEQGGPPALIRGPTYPAFIALSLLASGGWFPGSIWVAQSILHGLTAGLASFCALRLYGRSAGMLSGVICAAYPATIWYTPRIWSETLLAFLMILLFVALVSSSSKWTTRRSIVVGCILGILSLAKAVFLPLIVVVPIVLLFRRLGVGFSRMLLIPFIAILLVMPWTIRNYVVSGGIVPVHTGMYFNMKVGNIFADKWLEHPLSYNTIWYEHVVPVIREVSTRVVPGPSGDLQKERIYKSMVLDDFSSDLRLSLKKILSAGIMLWTVGDTPVKSLLNTVTRLPILILAIVGIRRELRRSFAAKVALILVGVYWVCHLPVGPPARLSTPVLPVLTIWAAVILLRAGNGQLCRFATDAGEKSGS